MLWLPALHAQQLLDRVVARVAGITITQTDVEAALALGVVEAEPGPDRMAAGIRQMIDRRLLLIEVARFPPPEPPEAAIAELAGRMRSRAGASDDALVTRTGVDDQRIRELARDTLRIQAYLDQRFGTATQVSAQEARDYYDAHRQEFVRAGASPPFEEVEAAVRQAAAADRRRRMIGQWLDDLRTRGEAIEVRSRP
jgi:hypothetical protein